MSYKVTYTVDDEKPDCTRCDHFAGWVLTDHKGEILKTNNNYCRKHCGTEHGWSGYKSVEEVIK